MRKRIQFYTIKPDELLSPFLFKDISCLELYTEQLQWKKNEDKNLDESGLCSRLYFSTECGLLFLRDFNIEYSVNNFNFRNHVIWFLISALLFLSNYRAFFFFFFPNLWRKNLVSPHKSCWMSGQHILISSLSCVWVNKCLIWRTVSRMCLSYWPDLYNISWDNWS